MKIEVKIEPELENILVEIHAPSMSEEIASILDLLQEQKPNILTGIKDGKVEVIEQEALIRIYAENGLVFAKTENGIYRLKIPLYQAEKRLDSNHFVRISNSEIIHLRKVKNFDLSFTGTICIEFINKETSYVSRRYVSKIKKLLGV